MSTSCQSPLKSLKPKNSLEKDLEEKGLLHRVKIDKRVAATSLGKVSEVKHQDLDKESDLSPKEIKQNQILDKGYDAAMQVIREARGKSPKTRDVATDKAADFITKAKCGAEAVVSSDKTDGVYYLSK